MSNEDPTTTAPSIPMTIPRAGRQDPLYPTARQIVISHQRGSISLVQRHMRIGYNRATDLIEAMVGDVLGEANAQGVRAMLPKDQWGPAPAGTDQEAGVGQVKESGQPQAEAAEKSVLDSGTAALPVENAGKAGETAEKAASVPEIAFYLANEKPFGAFSNLFRREITVMTRSFPTVEHAYQFLKPRDPRVRDWLMAAPAPSILALAAHVLPSDEQDPTMVMGRTADALLGFHTRPGWSRLRYPWMFECLRAKFAQHQDLRELLLSTGEARLVEAGKIDDDAGRRWGIVNGKGQNYLGRMLMRIRAELRGTEFEDQDLDARLAAGAEDLQSALADTLKG